MESTSIRRLNSPTFPTNSNNLVSQRTRLLHSRRDDPGDVPFGNEPQPSDLQSGILHGLGEGSAIAAWRDASAAAG